MGRPQQPAREEAGREGHTSPGAPHSAALLLLLLLQATAAAALGHHLLLDHVDDRSYLWREGQAENLRWSVDQGWAWVVLQNILSVTREQTRPPRGVKDAREDRGWH